MSGPKMGRDLCLIPHFHEMDCPHESAVLQIRSSPLCTEGEEFDGGWLGRTLLLMPRDGDLFDLIEELEVSPVARLSYYGDEGIELVTSDPYGDPLFSVEAGPLANVIEQYILVQREEYPNSGPYSTANAALGFLRGIPPNARVVLWWS